MNLNISDIDWSQETGSVFIKKPKGWILNDTAFIKNVKRDNGSSYEVAMGVPAREIVKSDKYFWEIKVQDIPNEWIATNGIALLQLYRNDDVEYKIEINISTELKNTRTYKLARGFSQFKKAEDNRKAVIETQGSFLKQALIEKIQTLANQISDAAESYSQAAHTF